jgi:phytoene dehydrogenase-like protein
MINRAVNSRLCLGGSHRLSNSICRVIQEDGRGQIRGTQRITRIIIEGGAAKGVELEDGTIHEAEKGVVSSIDPHQTFLNYVGEEHLSEDFASKVRNWHWEKWSLFSVHMALEQPPHFTTANGDSIDDALMYVVGYETPDDVIEHWRAIERGELPAKPAFNCCFPTVHDPSQAPQGRHTGVISEMVPFGLNGDGDRWYNLKLKEAHQQLCLSALGKYAPNIGDSVLWTYILTPLDFSNKYLNMAQGSIKQGAYEVFQMAVNRPNDECSSHRTPIQNLYVCGASVNPGGLVTFGPGYIAANTIAEDHGIEKWWPEPELVSAARAKGYFGTE